MPRVINEGAESENQFQCNRGTPRKVVPATESDAQHPQHETQRTDDKDTPKGTQELNIAPQGNKDEQTALKFPHEEAHSSQKTRLSQQPIGGMIAKHVPRLVVYTSIRKTYAQTHPPSAKRAPRRIKIRARQSLYPERRRRVVIREGVILPDAGPEETVLTPDREGANR